MNSVRLELLKIDRQWYGQVKGHAGKPLFVCLGEKHGLKLFDAYFKSRSADGMESRDLFLTYYRPFDDAREYGRPLLADLQLAYGAKRTAFRHRAKNGGRKGQRRKARRKLTLGSRPKP